jgi:hypothetical protein
VQTSPPSVSVPEKAAVWEDFVDILFSPSAVFARRKAGSFMIPLVIVTLLVGIAFLFTSESIRPIFDAEFDRAMAAQAAASGKPMPPETLQRMREFALNIGRIAVFIFLPIGIFLGGGALWIAGKVLGAALTIRTALVISAYSQVPRVLEAVVNGIQGVVVDPASLDGQFRLTLGPGRFLDPDTTSAVLLVFLGPLDLFTLWVTALVAIGFAATTGISLSRASIGAAFVWLVTVLPRLPGALSQM